MRSSSVLIPDALHICPRCGDHLASGMRLCEDCIALQEIGRNVDAELRRELAWYRSGGANPRERRAVIGLYIAVLAGALGFGVWKLIEVIR